MARLPVLSGREVIKLLSKHGFSTVGRKGSHVRMKNIIQGKAFIAIVPDHGDLPLGTLKSIIR